jgi:predicted RNase H-like nuclease (RuvC/YqgF family)
MQEIATMLTALAALGGLFLSAAAFVSMRRMRAAEAQEKEEKARTEKASRAKLEDEITEKVLARANKELDKLQGRLDVEVAARLADKLLYEAEIEKLRNEVHTERSARGLIETKLIEAQQRITALEDELLKREKRIKELESNSGAFPAARPHGFK